MNGIIHPCARPEGRPPPATPEEMYAAIFSYIDRVFSVVRPRKLLFLAIDGEKERERRHHQHSLCLVCVSLTPMLCAFAPLL